VIAGDEDDSSWIICEDCGANVITLGELRDEIARQARDYATRSIRESFGRVPTSRAES
jgi:hypothetical protein